MVFLHGLTDTPYSGRHIGRAYRDRGWLVLIPRMPGHGTVPAGLTDVEWEDWTAAVRLAVREARRRVGPGRPLHLVGFSNGAVMAAAALLAAPALSSGAVLLRPLSPRPGEQFPALPGYPVLLLGGAADARRHPSDTPVLAEQFRQAGAHVAAQVLPLGHGLDEAGEDVRLTRDWLAGRA